MTNEVFKKRNDIMFLIYKVEQCVDVIHQDITTTKTLICYTDDNNHAYKVSKALNWVEDIDTTSYIIETVEEEEENE